MEDKKVHPLHCGFCGKTEKEVMVLFAGPDIFICNECIKLCVEIIREDYDPHYCHDKMDIEDIRSILKELSQKNERKETSEPDGK